MFVACKHPNGLKLDLHDQDGKITDSVTLFGGRLPVDDNGIPTQIRAVVGGYGFTEVKDEFWNEWSRTYKDFEPLKRGMIFACGTLREAKHEAAVREGIVTGLEPVDPDKKTADGVEAATEDDGKTPRHTKNTRRNKAAAEDADEEE